MLDAIYIRNFALINDLTLELQFGATMLTGETGAGKSIILGAIDIALGQRASSDKIKPGAEQAEIILNFVLTETSPAAQWLKAQDYLSDNDNNNSDNNNSKNLYCVNCIIRRLFTRSGRSKCYINDRPAPVNSLKQLGQLLVLMHGQQDNQLLLSKNTQTQMLDAIADNQVLLDQISQHVTQWQSLTKQLDQHQANTQEKQQRLDFIAFQLNELSALDLSAEAITALPAKHQQLANAEQLIHAYQSGLDLIAEQETNLLTQTNQLSHIINTISEYNQQESNISNLAELAETASIQLSEIHQQFQTNLHAIDIDNAELANLEQQMSLVHGLAKKYQCEPEQLPELKNNLVTEQNQLANSQTHSDELQQTINQEYQAYLKLTKKLTKKRQACLTQFNQTITELLHQLGMPHASFQAEILPNQQISTPQAHGQEQIQFLLRTNPGHPAQPLHKIASGGELARTSLALQVTLAKYIAIPTLIFDEIDTGVGGKTAAVIGQLLKQLSQTHQILCITHQAQVAASGQQHWQVSKSPDTKNNSTQVTITDLTQAQRIEELARMLGGLSITQHTRDHAKEMLALA